MFTLFLLVVLVAQRTVVVAAGNRCDDAVVKQKGDLGNFRRLIVLHFSDEHLGH